MLENLDMHALAGQFFGLVALVMCLLAFANKDDDRLMILLISANVAFVLQFVFFASWTAAALTALVIVRIMLARRYRGNKAVMSGVLALSGIATLLTWQSLHDIFPLMAMVLGTAGMFLLSGIAMRAFLGLAALAWMINNLLIGSIGGSVAEGLVVVTNIITIIRLTRAKRRYPEIFD